MTVEEFVHEASKIFFTKVWEAMEFWSLRNT